MGTTDHHTLIAAARAGDAQKVQELLPVTHAREKNKALVEAAKNGHTTCVRALLSMCKNERENQRALLHAFRNDHAQCVKLLLPYYAGVEKDHMLLMTAASAGRVDMVRILAQVSQQRPINDALIAAAIGGHYECAEELVAKASCSAKSEALGRAALEGHLQLVELLIPVSDPKSNDSKALKHAVMGKHHQCIEALLDVSNTQKVLAYFKQVFHHNPDNWMFFAEMVESWSQRATLTAVTQGSGDKQNAPLRSAKKM